MTPFNVTIDPRTKDLVFGGFYRHFKHDPAGSPANMFYQVLNLTHSKDAELSFVCYRPLYEESPVYQAGRGWDNKVPDLWFLPTPPEFNGKIRYELITESDPDYELCKAQVKKLYGEGPESFYGKHVK